ncbi:hypothetical protein Tco_1043403 [Tanacetum coccineum]|uniref:CCHC-type domain-containing protein n=1 Tax=Tanacetum coccineum TaxID=301880 RepID=A0ABQ5GLX4_9ASTR
MQKAVLKQQFEAFTISSSEGLEKGYDRFQQLLSQLRMQIISFLDLCLQLGQIWQIAMIVIRMKKFYKKTGRRVRIDGNKPVEREVPAGFADEVIYSLFAKQSKDLDLLHEDLEQIDDVDIEEMDINWQIAMIAIRMKKFYKKTGRRVRIDGNKPGEHTVEEEETNHALMAISSNNEGKCSSCGALYNKSCGCSKGGLIDKFVRDPNKMPDSSQRPPIVCVKCGNPVEGPSCQGCALWRKKLKEVWFTTCHENGINQDLLNTSESSDDDTNVVNAPREPFVVKHDPGENSSRSPPQLNHNCCYECGESLDGIFCQQCTCKSCGKGAHIGYNCPPKAPIISNPEPCNQTIDELPQTLPGMHSYPTLATPRVATLDVDQIDDEVLENTNSIPPGIEYLCFNAKFDLLESLLHRDTSINDSQKIDSLLDEFAGELTLPHSIPPGIDDINLDPEGDTLFLESLLYDNSSPRLPEEFNSENPTESFSPSPIPVEDSDSLMEEIDIFLDGDDSIPPGIESDDFDSEDDDNSTSRPEFESFHVDYPDSGDSTIDVVEDIPVDVPNILPTHPALQLDFNFIFSNDVGSDLDDSSPSGDSNKNYDPGICIEVKSTRFLATLSPVIDTLIPFSSENDDKVCNHRFLNVFLLLWRDSFSFIIGGFTPCQNHGTWKLTQLKKLSFEEVKEEFDKLVKQVESFVPMNIEATKAQLKRYGEELQTEISKKQDLI